LEVSVGQGIEIFKIFAIDILKCHICAHRYVREVEKSRRGTAPQMTQIFTDFFDDDGDDDGKHEDTKGTKDHEDGGVDHKLHEFRELFLGIWKVCDDDPAAFSYLVPRPSNFSSCVSRFRRLFA
jgi:hypothetical protein